MKKLHRVLALAFFLTNTTIFSVDPLSFILIKKGSEAFINESKKYSEQEYNSALKSVITCAEKNKTTISSILENLRNTLHKKIQKIDLIKNKALGDKIFNSGIGIIFLSFAFLYFSYNRQDTIEHELNFLKKSLREDGIMVYEGRSYATFYTCFGVPIDSKMISNFIRLKEDQSVMLSTIASVFLYLIGIYTITYGYCTSDEPKYLEKYQKFLTITDEMIAKHVPQSK